MPPMLGRLEWYVTTIGILLVVLLGRGVNASSLHGFQSTILICFKTNVFNIPWLQQNRVNQQPCAQTTHGMHTWYAILAHPGMT